MRHRLNGNGHLDINVVRCPGDLNAAQMVQLKSRFERLKNRKRKFLLVDLSRARRVDLAGLGILVDRIRRFRSLKGDIRLFNIQPEVLEILKTVGLTHLIETFGNEEEARESFQIA